MDTSTLRELSDAKCGRWNWFCACAPRAQAIALHEKIRHYSSAEFAVWYDLHCSVCAVVPNAPDVVVTPPGPKTPGVVVPPKPVPTDVGSKCAESFKKNVCNPETVTAMDKGISGIDTLTYLPGAPGFILPLKYLRGKLIEVRTMCAKGGPTSEEEGNVLCDTLSTIGKYGDKLPAIVLGVMPNWNAFIKGSQAYVAECCSMQPAMFGSNSEFDKMMQKLITVGQGGTGVIA